MKEKVQTSSEKETPDAGTPLKHQELFFLFPSSPSVSSFPLGAVVSALAAPPPLYFFF
jgi:hypothetical protein